MLQPTPEQFALLSAFERFSYRLADLVVRRFSLPSIIWNRTLGSMVVRFCGGRRLRYTGLEHIHALGHNERVMMVANHRSFFDYFVIAWVNLSRTKLTKRILFPVRAKFFYTRPLGPIINMFLTGMTMFPPIMRQKDKREFNQFSMARLMEEMAIPGTTMGFHPEGTRNKTNDPYALLPARRGVGEIILRAEGITVVPIFVLGMTNNLLREAWTNWTNPSKHPIDIVYGAPITFDDLKTRTNDHESQLMASQRCMDAIAELASSHRESTADLIYYHQDRAFRKARGA